MFETWQETQSKLYGKYVMSEKPVGHWRSFNIISGPTLIRTGTEFIITYPSGFKKKFYDGFAAYTYLDKLLKKDVGKGYYCGKCKELIGYYDKGLYVTCDCSVH